MVPAGELRWELSPEKLKLLELLLEEKREQARRKPDAIAISAERQHFPVSFAQRRFWLLDRITTGRSGYTIDKAVRLKGMLEVPALEQALIEIQRRHESLRTTFEFLGDDLRQIVHPPRKMPLAVEDLSHWGREDQEEKIRSLAEEETFATFDLAAGPLLRARLLRLGEREHVMLLAMHHIICDGWSIAIFLNELAILYEAFRSGKPSPLPELKIQYADFAVWQRDYLGGEEGKKQRSYWRNQLRGLPLDLDLPTDRDASSIRSLHGAMESIVLPAEICNAARSLGRKHDATLFMVLLSAFNLLLFRYTHQQDFAVGSPIANRRRSETEALIGVFINTLVLRARPSDHLTVRELIKQVQQTTLEAYANQDLPFEEIVEDLNPERGPGKQLLFQVLFTLRNEPTAVIKLPDLELVPLSHSNPASPLDLDFSIHEIGDELSCWMLYDTDLFDQSSIQRMLGHFRNVLKSMVHHADERIGTLPLLGPEERRQLLVLFNPQAKAGPSQGRCIHELFEDHLEQHPQAIAAVSQGATITYGELNRSANRLGRYLRKVGVGPEVRVGVCFEPSNLEILTALLGVLKCGGVYVPLDPGYPEERLRYILEDSAPAVLLVQKELKERFAAVQASMPLLDLADAQPWQAGPESNLERKETGLAAGHLAYILYTSGSSGAPKGVMVPHLALCDQISALTDYWELSPEDRILFFHAINFDVSLEEIFCSLISGATLVLRTDEWLSGISEFFRLCEQEALSVIDFPTRFWQQLFTEERPLPPALRLIMIGGETVEQSALAVWFNRYGQSLRLCNAYGPTEATINVTVQELTPDPSSWRSIGAAFESVQMRILDGNGELTPIGVMGELCIGGTQLARGYLNRADLTAEQFVPDVYSDWPGTRIYRTGDRGRWLENGTIEFLGRSDDQVKIRGYRIEPGEIKAALLEQGQVKEAAVLVRETAGGDNHLVAYYTLWPQENESVGPEELRQYLWTKLPKYMVPWVYVRLEEMPLTSNGKLDEKALPAPEMDAFVAVQHEAPQGEIETTLAAIWAELLKIEKVGRYENFFELGGHSLLGMRVISRIQQQLGVVISVAELFARPVLADLAASLESAALATRPAIRRVEKRDHLPLSFAQQRLWFLATMEGGSAAYNVPVGLRLKGELHQAALQQALDRIIARHEVLRTRFVAVNGNPIQWIAPAAESRFHLVEHDLRQHADPDGELEHWMKRERTDTFDLEAGPLIRGRLIRHSENEHTLLITAHHIIIDEWSTDIFLRELSRLYEAFRRGEKDPLPPLKVQYADYAVWERQWIGGKAEEQQAEYWKAALQDAPAGLELPADSPRPLQQDYKGAFQNLELSQELTAGLKQLSRRHGTTLYTTVVAAWAALLARLSGQTEVVVGTPVANRDQAEIEGLIGFFVNTVPLRVDVSRSPTVEELLQKVKKTVVDAQRNQSLPFERLVELASPVRSLAYSPIFQSMLAWQSAPETTLGLSGVDAKVLESVPQTAKFDLTLFLGEKGGAASGGLEYATALFEPATIRRYAGYFRKLLEGMIAGDAQVVERLPLLHEDEWRQVVFQWNDTARDYPSEKCVSELFEEQAEKTPDSLAVEYQEQRLTYRELNQASNQLGHYLRRLGVKPDARVGICMERGLEMIVGLLGTLKAGGTYVPLDPAYPVQRLRFVLEDSKPTVLLTQRHLRGLFHGMEETVRFVELQDAALWSDEPRTNLERSIQGSTECLVYLIYTSGSTGRPKGVAMPMAAAVNLLWWQISQSKMAAPEPQRTLQFAALGFDVSFQETFSTLCSGGTLVLIEEPKRYDARLARFVLEQRIQRLFLPYVGLQIFAAGLAEMEDVFTDRKHFGAELRQIIVAGEQLRIDPRIRDTFRHLENCKLENQYGPTETHVVSSYCLGPRSEKWPMLPSIGQPIANTQIYILDNHGEPVPVGVIGELYIGGTGVARGYLNRPELTAERFLVDPFANRPGARMYKTGDRARWLADGTIEFLGRNDDQVKIRGYRIELGEIEAQLAEYAGVKESAVVAREDAPGEKRLVAYYIAAANSDEKKPAEPNALRSYLAGRLPEYMVPVAYVRMEEMPLSPNGKLNRKALPAPEGNASAAPAYEVPEGETERILAEIWAELVHVKQVGRRDNFFALGGHSLLAVRLVSSVQKTLQAAITIADVFAHPVLADLARSLKSAAKADLPAIRRAGQRDKVPLSFAQQRLWFLAKLEGVSEAYHIPVGLRLKGRLNRAVLRQGLDRVVARHEVLRTTFVVVDGAPMQQIAPIAESRFHLIEHDLCQHRDAKKELDLLIKQEAEEKFDLAAGPLVRGRLVREQEDEYTLLITMHHIVSDGWSLAVFGNEVVRLYAAFLRGEADPLPELAVQYSDYALWQRQWMTGEVLQQQSEYWKNALRGAPALLELSVDHPRPPEQDYHGAFEELVLGEELTRGLKDLSRRRGTTLFMTLLAGWAALLARLSGQQDVVVGTPTANRGQAEIEGLIGFFVNTLALRLDVSGFMRVSDLLEQAKSRVLGAQQHQDIPFEQVVEMINPARSLAHSPIFQAMFSWQNAPAARPEFFGLETRPLASAPYRTAKFDLTLFLQEKDERITGGLEYATALFEPGTLRRYKGYFCKLLEAMVMDDAQPVHCLPMLSDIERQEILYQWNECAAQIEPGCLQTFFERQAERAPQALAVEYGKKRLSYGELNRRANQIAHYLRELQVGPEIRVGLCLPRSPEMLAAMLGILKAGGVYVPLDPSYPPERLQFMVEDSQAAILVSTSAVQLPWKAPVVRLDDEQDRIARQSGENPGVQADGENLAYIIYTSGSTGRPKGVGIRHSSAAVLVEWARQEYRTEEIQVVLASTSVCFDLSVYEILVPLSMGGTVIVVENALDFASLAAKDRVTLVNTVPSAMAELVQHGLPGALRVVNLAGEALPAALVKQIYEQLGNARVMNLYGPTEDTTYSTYEWVRRVEAEKEKISIGRPILNTQAYVFDAHCQPVGTGIVGELYLGGAGLARGYVNRPELTAEKFVPHPYSRTGGERLYRTGDLVRRTKEGKLEFLGRADQQVKVHGYRIELEEIEAVLMEHAGVKEAVAIVRGDTLADKCLVAYYTALENESEKALDAEEFRQYLRGKLPGYMVPSAYVRLETLPLTPNGKLDRKGLPAPEKHHSGRVGYIQPGTPMEELVAQVWQEVLGLERVGIRDDFFAIGGHSLSAMHLLALLETRSGKKLPLAALFRQPTVEHLAALLEEKNENRNLSCLVRIRTAGSRKPLFLVHPVGGAVHCYKRLADLVSTERPVYAFQSHALNGLPPFSQIPQMAKEYLKEMIAVQPEGPYFLGGWSMGGVVAFEMALQLRSLQLPVALLALFDSYPNFIDQAPDLNCRDEAFVNCARELGISIQELRTQQLDSGNLREEQILRRVVELAKGHGTWPREFDGAEAARIFEVFKAHTMALGNYKPHGGYDGTILLLHAAQSGSAHDLAKEWRRFCSGAESHSVPGDHYGILKEPGIYILAEHLNSSMERAEAELDLKCSAQVRSA